jgi:hypothetical protein
MARIWFFCAICISHGCVGQTIQTDTLNKKIYSKILFNDGFVIYQPSCAEGNFYLMIGNYIVRYDSIMKMEYLRSHNHDSNFVCQTINDLSFLNTLKALVVTNRRLVDKIGLLAAMKSNNDQFVAALFIFKSKKFTKFIKKADKSIYKDLGSGETSEINIYDFKKSYSEFMFSIINGKLVSNKNK